MKEGVELGEYIGAVLDNQVNPECEAFVPEDKRGYRKKASSAKTAAKPGEKK